MTVSKAFVTCFSLAAACLIVGACASRPVLPPKSATVPAAVDLSGRWRLRARLDSDDARDRDLEPGIRIPPPNSRRRPEVRAARGSLGPAVNVFIENGDRLNISQTPAGLFISFDRSVVEEYTFGENRRVSVGPIEAQRVSGWQDDALIVQTLDEKGALLTETWRLADSGQVLRRDIVVTRGERELFSATQLFDKV